MEDQVNVIRIGSNDVLEEKLWRQECIIKRNANAAVSFKK